MGMAGQWDGFALGAIVVKVPSKSISFFKVMWLSGKVPLMGNHPLKGLCGILVGSVLVCYITFGGIFPCLFEILCCMLCCH